MDSNTKRHSPCSLRTHSVLGRRGSQDEYKYHNHRSVWGPEEGGGSFTEDVASELGFNEEKSLVDEEGEGHCSQKEQQHMQVACAVTAAPLVWMEHKGWGWD